RRLHMHDGPIDVVAESFGTRTQIARSYQAAARRFAGLLDELCAELPGLRQAATPNGPVLSGPVARRMLAAVMPYAPTTFITPMAAVAGAVSEEILAAMVQSADLDRAYVNDGGDIAIHLAPGSRFVVGMADRADRAPTFFSAATIEAREPVR